MISEVQLALKIPTPDFDNPGAPFSSLTNYALTKNRNIISSNDKSPIPDCCLLQTNFHSPLNVQLLYLDNRCIHSMIDAFS